MLSLRFHPIDIQQIQLIGNLSPNNRMWLMLKSQRLARAAIRSPEENVSPGGEQ